MNVAFLRAGEQLVRLHRFRFANAQGCALGSVEIMVEEAVGAPGDSEGQGCTARPDHPRLVAKPDYTAHGDTVEAALQSCIERMRPRPLTDVFLPAR